MGAIFFCHTICATSEKEGLDHLVQEAIETYGRDDYNGTISTCNGCRCVKRYDKYSDKNKTEATEIMLNMKKTLSTRDVRCIDLGCVQYVVRTIKKENLNYTAEFKQKFVVRDYSGRSHGTYDRKSEADESAIKLALEGKDVYVEKTQVQLSGNSKVATFNCINKLYKTKPKLKSLPNRKIYEIHKYLFFGWAAE